MNHKPATTAVLMTMLGFHGVSFAHDLYGLMVERNALSPAARVKLEEIDQLRRILAANASAKQDSQLEAVVQQALRWTKKQVTICFFDGSQPTRDHVATVASQWTKQTALQFDFGPAGKRRTCDVKNPSDIRISFAGLGHYSYVGTHAQLVEVEKQTMNLQGLDKGTGFSDSDNGVILHEFGHAIGFEHEHQSPSADCEKEFDWQYLYVSLGWSKEEVDRNMRRLTTPIGKTGLFATAFDPQSNMLYSLSPLAFREGTKAKCFIANPNDKLSETDLKAARTVYPAAPPGAPAAAPSSAKAPSAVKEGDAAIAQSVRRLRGLVESGSKR